jgi:8-oxo-dGTP pyrophosphatase MutT (NUDIX family)
MAPHGAAEFVRTPLIALEYLAAFHGYISMGYQDGFDYLSLHEKLDEADRDLLRECDERKSSSRYTDVDHTLMLAACEFLDRTHSTLVKTYRRRGVSDIRWNGSTCEVHWNLDLPQAAAMTIIRRREEVLLLRRPSDDYLYPNQWTIPGGYLQHAENPSQAAARELIEETGLRLIPAELFSGRPVISDRLAAFVFWSDLSDPSIAPCLVEHDASSFVPLDSAMDMELTPEARLILEQHLNVIRTPMKKL